MSPYASYIVETFLTLLAVCALAFVVLYGARRLGLGRASGPITLCGQLPLDRRRAIYLVKVGKQVFVVGVGDGVFTKLGELSEADLPKGGAVTPAPFGDVLAKILGRKRPDDAPGVQGDPTGTTGAGGAGGAGLE